ncbi:MAG TPA: VIT domain-containing protein [Gemmatimonadales bacterium]|nr:VIT domain-containing protein [Gemmatimonadales bacterium]
MRSFQRIVVASLAPLASLALLGVLALPAGAQGWIEPIRPWGPPIHGQVEKVRSAVDVQVTGRVARVSVEEWFRNTGPRLDEGSYLYPLPGEAVFSNFSLWQGDQELRGEPMDAAQARAVYEAIVRQKRDPALIELAGHGLVRARVFPINPGETRKITLRYTELLDRTGDAWRFRYAAGTGPGAAGAARSFHLAMDSAGRFGDPYSPTHRVSVSRHDDRVELTLADTSAPGDLELFLPLSRGLVGMSVVTDQPVGEDGYFMLLVAPGRAAAAQSLGRDVVAVLDVSGSMSGTKLEQAKAALVQLLGTLRPNDRFRLITFGSGVRRYAQEWTAVTPDHLRAAGDWVRQLDTDGGTNIAGALTEAFAQPPRADALGVVVFLTDGMPTVGETDPERIADQAERGRGPFRVFAFGIGYDVNTYLLDRLTERARGVAQYLAPGGDIEQAVGTLATKVASPVMTDLALSADGVELYDLQPQGLPDLFAGDELAVFGRVRGSGSGEHAVTVTGRRQGQQERFSTIARFGGSASGGDYIAQLWAARKAGALSRELRLHGGNPELMDELKRLALRYGILTEYTSYLVQEPNVVVRRQNWMAPLAAARADQVGASAMRRSETERQMANAAVVPSPASLPFTVGGGTAGGGGRTERVGGRLFVWHDSTWTDIGHADSLRVVTVAVFSDAYFALLRALPELTKPAALGSAVLVAGRRVSIKLEASGTTAWAEGELAALVRDFRT